MLSLHLKRSGQQTAQRFQFFIGECMKQNFATQAAIKATSGEAGNESWENARPFSEIPSPSLWKIATAFLPGGTYYKKSPGDMIQGFEKKYGAIIRWPGIFGRPDIIVTLNPDDFATIFRNEGQWPNRRNLDSLIYYREVHRKDFLQNAYGVMTNVGEEWAKARTSLNPILMQQKNAVLYSNTMLEINDEFLKRIREIRDPVTFEVPETFEDDINRLTLETVAAVALNTQLGLLRKNRDSEESKTIMRNVRKFFDLAFYLEVTPSIWKYVATPKFKEMMRTLDTFTDICNKYINEAIAKIEHDSEGNVTTETGKEKSVLEKLLKIDKKLAVVTALDMMMAGIDTTSSSLVGILLCLAKSPEKQEKLFNEVKQIMPEKDTPLTIENMRNLPYLRACIKEGMRVYPLFVGTMRSLPKDVVLSGYQIPAGTEISICSNLLINDERYVPQPKEFIPERFLRNDENKKLAGKLQHPFIFLPFGFGPRSCVGKRIVNLEMEITIASLVRNFNIEFNYPVENAFKTKLISAPAIPLKFKFAERSN